MRNNYIARKYEGPRFLSSTRRKNVHPIPQSLAVTPRRHPERSVVVQCTTEDDLPPNCPGCDAHPRDPLRRRGGTRQRWRISVIRPTR